MKFASLFLILASIASPAYAQLNRVRDIKDDISRSAVRLSRIVYDSPASAADLEAAHQKLRQALDIVRGGGGSSGQRLLCVARDNDNRKPFVPAIRDQNLVLIPYRNVTFATMEECQAQMAGSVYAAGSDLVCAAKDGDAQKPYAIFVMGQNGQATRTGLVYQTLNECGTALNQGYASSSELLTCVSRDGDGRKPWITVKLQAGGVIVRGQQIMDTFEQCMRQL